MTIPTGQGRLCKRKHDDGTGHSIRYLVDGIPMGNCVICGREANRVRKAEQRHSRLCLAEEQGRTDGKYIGKPCRNGHDGLRYVIDGSCVECDKHRRRRRAQDPDRRPIEQARKKVQNRARAVNELDDADLRQERARTFEHESRRRALRKRAREHGT